jgi:DNA processing protein
MDINPLAKYWLWFSSCFGAGGRAWDIVSMFSSIDEAYYTLKGNQSARTALLTEKEKQFADRTHIEQCERVLDYCAERNIGVVCFDDEDYPSRLRSIFNPPCQLFYRGNIGGINEAVVLSVVGTRNPSEYSTAVTKALVRELVSYDTVIASGFAVGIDITAHLACAKNGGRTVAVLGCGIDCDYPAENVRHRDEILTNGVIISEFFPGARPSKTSFPQRNRILSGLSLGTIIIEAGEKSGSLVTANLALQQGRDIFCVPPHNIFSTRYAGNVRLLRDGAIAVFGKQDILYEYYENYSHKLSGIRASQGKIADNGSIDVSAEKNSSKAFDITELSEEQAAVAKILEGSDAPMLADEVAAAAEMEISDVLMILTDLELEGIVISCAGQTYKLK